MTKVLFLVNSLDVGGIERYLLRVLEHSGRRLQATVLCKSGWGGELALQYERAGAQLVMCKIPLLPGIGHLKLFRALRMGQYDAVCDFSGGFAGLPILVALLSGTKTRIAFYRESRYQFKKTAPKLIYAKILDLLTRATATSILSNSHDALDHFHPNWKSRADRYRVVQNGIPGPKAQPANVTLLKRRELGVPPACFLVGHTGRYTPAKNHEQIIRVAGEVLRKDDRFRFLLCGRGVKDHVQPMVDSAGLSRYFLLFNSRQDLDEILPCLDAFYFPSLNEGMPNSLIEAWTYGIPFVSSNIAAISNLLPQQYQHCLVDPNDVAGAAKALINMANGAAFPSEALQSWAVGEFDQEKKFGEFLSELQA